MAFVRSLCSLRALDSIKVLFPRHQTARSFHGTRCKQQMFGRSNQSSTSFRDRGYALLLVPATTFLLGGWQVYRRNWKLGLIADMEARVRTEPVPLPEDLDELIELEYRKVCVRGEFDHGREMYIYPRYAVEDDGEGAAMISSSHHGKIGAYVVTPFKMADRDLWILVNRGWVSRKEMKPTNRASGQTQGEVDLIGVVRQSEKIQTFGGDPNPSKREWHSRDIEGMAEAAGTAPALLDADLATSTPGGPIGGQTRVTVRNEHVSYIFTWYSLTFATFWMWYRRYWKLARR